MLLAELPKPTLFCLVGDGSDNLLLLELLTSLFTERVSERSRSEDFLVNFKGVLIGVLSGVFVLLLAVMLLFDLLLFDAVLLTVLFVGVLLSLLVTLFGVV